MSKVLVPGVASQNSETIIDELLSSNGQTVVAQWKLTEGEFGNLATYVEFSDEVDNILKHENMFQHPKGDQFYTYRSAAISAREFAANRKFGKFVRKIGFSYGQGAGYHRQATMPTADYLSNVLDTWSYPENRMRFYEPTTDTGKISGVDFIKNLTEGKAPLSGANTEWFSHDLMGHSVGYMLLQPRTVAWIRVRAQELIEAGLEIDEKGSLVYGSPGEFFAGGVDRLSSDLNAPLTFQEEKIRRKRFSDIARVSGALILGESSQFPPRRAYFKGLGPAIGLVREINQLTA